jgi:DTW domain-containing protein YfiP
MQPHYSCYCEHIRRFDPNMKFVILIHPIEMKRRIATGRMSHLSLEDSNLIMGHDYSENKRVNEILADSRFHPVVLYPGPTSVNLTYLEAREREDLFPQDKRLAVFVIDGTWGTARQMMNRSQNLKTLPRISFSPPAPSNFRVRKQPRPGCYSTIEAIHHTIELLGQGRGFPTETRIHDHLLHVFARMVERQLEFVPRDHLRLRRVQDTRP